MWTCVSKNTTSVIISVCAALLHCFSNPLVKGHKDRMARFYNRFFIFKILISTIKFPWREMLDQLTLPKKKNSKKCLGCFLKENKNIYKESALEVKIIKSHTLLSLKRNSVICFTKNVTD